MTNWISGLPFEDIIIRANFLCDSMSLVVDENDTNSYDWNLFKLKNDRNSQNRKLYKASGGFKFWDGTPVSAPPTTIPPPGTGPSQYFYGLIPNFGSWNNRATTIHIYGTNYQVFCSKKAFRGNRFFNCVFGIYGHNLSGTPWDNNIMSAF